jgi:Icc-related predicted phosphoesterase
MKLLWITDSHFDFVPGKAGMLGKYMAADYPDTDGLLITGDISNGNYGKRDLKDISVALGKPVYFINGNHDYYHSSFERTDKRSRDAVKEVAEHVKTTPSNASLHFLDDGFVKIDDNTVIAGNSNWYDCRHGNVFGTPVDLTDFQVNKDLRQYAFREQKIDASKAYADKKASQMFEMLSSIPDDISRIILLLHVPPYPQAAWHQGQPSNSDWQPWMVSKVSGEKLLDFREQFPDKKLLVLCGHTHSSGYFKVDDNLEIYTGKAVYGSPKECGILDTDKWEVTFI